MARWGHSSLGYESDLDIVFLFDSGQALSDGPRPLPPERYFARLAQRVLSFLTVMTPSGRLYDVDTRLRPNGRAGSLVSSIEAFCEYQAERSLDVGAAGADAGAVCGRQPAPGRQVCSTPAGSPVPGKKRTATRPGPVRYETKNESGARSAWNHPNTRRVV